MVRIGVLEKLRMRKQNTKTTVPLDAVPERRTERCSSRFRPGERFLGEPSFRYLSPGTGGEKCRTLDRRWQIPFIHSAQLTSCSIFYINRLLFELFPPCGTFKGAAVLCIFGNGACTLANTLFRLSESFFKSCCVPYGTCWRVLEEKSKSFTHAYFLNERESSRGSPALAQSINKSVLVSLLLL